MSIFSITGTMLSDCYDVNGTEVDIAYNVLGDVIYHKFPSGEMSASSTVVLPDIYNTGKGFTCTGLAYDEDTDTFLIGDIGKALPSDSGFHSQLIRVSSDFTTVVETIPLYTTFAGMSDVQGVTIDTSDGSIWLCSPGENLIRHISTSVQSLGTISVTNPTGISYSSTDDSLWILTYANKILHYAKDGTQLGSYNFAYNETLDQCCFVADTGLLYITAGANYSTRNNVYCFGTSTHSQFIACTVDSYSVEGIYISETEMVIVNDGYYHSAADPRNVANIYSDE